MEKELKHDFSTPSGIVFKALVDKSKELEIDKRLSIHHFQEMTKAVMNTRTEAPKVEEAIGMISKFEGRCKVLFNGDAQAYCIISDELTKIRNVLEG